MWNSGEGMVGKYVWNAGVGISWRKGFDGKDQPRLGEDHHSLNQEMAIIHH